MIIDTRQNYAEPTLANAFNLWVDIHAPIAVVFRFLTDERDLARWWCSSATSETRPGGRLHYVWRGESEVTGDAFFRRFEPPNLVTIEWTHHNGSPILSNGEDHRGMVWSPLNIYELALINTNTTRLHLHDIGINSAPQFESLRKASADGWVEAATRLKKVIENYLHDEMGQQIRKRHLNTEERLGSTHDLDSNQRTENDPA